MWYRQTQVGFVSLETLVLALGLAGEILPERAVGDSGSNKSRAFAECSQLSRGRLQTCFLLPRVAICRGHSWPASVYDLLLLCERRRPQLRAIHFERVEGAALRSEKRCFSDVLDCRSLGCSRGECHVGRWVQGEIRRSHPAMVGRKVTYPVMTR